MFIVKTYTIIFCKFNHKVLCKTSVNDLLFKGYSDYQSNKHIFFFYSCLVPGSYCLKHQQNMHASMHLKFLKYLL